MLEVREMCEAEAVEAGLVGGRRDVVRDAVEEFAGSGAEFAELGGWSGDIDPKRMYQKARYAVRRLGLAGEVAAVKRGDRVFLMKGGRDG